MFNNHVTIDKRGIQISFASYFLIKHMLQKILSGPKFYGGFVYKFKTSDFSVQFKKDSLSLQKDRLHGRSVINCKYDY